jgi:multiple sugar transport system substrate-binding protein
MKSLYHLDQGGVSGNMTGGKKDLGKLPAASVALIVVIIFAWVMIGVVALKDKMKARQ